AISVLPMDSSVAETLVTDDRFRVLTFTGSPAVGWDLRKKAGRKRVLLELGGNAGVIVHDDADLDLALERTAAGAFAYSGQVCISIQRIYVHERIHAEFSRRLLEKIRTLSMGDPMDEKTDIGPMIDESNAARVERNSSSRRCSPA